MSRPLIFLSYGRRDTQSLAERLRADLIARGYEVWQDTERIRRGWDWDEEIEVGLSRSQALLALLSPHAVRRAGGPGNPDNKDSVCLDEIAYARGACRIPIIPVNVVDCEAPLLIYRLQAVDFRRWQNSDAQYAAALDQLCKSLEAALRGEQRERSWDALPEPWDFGPLLYEKRRDFTGRAWLFERIDCWRTQNGSSALLLIGDPGIGKTAVVAELVHTNPGGQILAYHCCQADTLATIDPARFVYSLAAMIGARLDVYAAVLQQPNVQHELSRADKDPASAFEAGVLSPLHQIQPPEGGVRYILIDALDEALTWRSDPTIVDLIASRLQRMPPWLRVVATTRDERAVRDRLDGVETLTIGTRQPENLHDTQQYVERRIATPAVQARLMESGRAAHAVQELILRASDGNFLIARTVLDAVKQKQLTLEQIEDLPPGLGSLYRAFFARLYPDPATGYSLARAVLQTVVAAQEPLTRKQLAAVTKLNADDELPSLLEHLAAFLPHREGRYALFHKSVADWLTGWDETRDQSLAGAYFVNPMQGHSRLAAWGWSEYLTGCRTMSDYALKHLLVHLAATARWDDLARMLTDDYYLEVKFEKTGGLQYELQENFRSALRQMPRDHAAYSTLSVMLDAFNWMDDLGASSHYDLDYSLPALIKAGRAVVPLVRLHLSDSDPIVRHRTIHVLKWIGDTRVVPDLIGLLADSEVGDFASRICDLAADALQHLGTPQAVQAVGQWRQSQGTR